MFGMKKARFYIEPWWDYYAKENEPKKKWRVKERKRYGDELVGVATSLEAAMEILNHIAMRMPE
jgi:hypothetical protein